MWEYFRGQYQEMKRAHDAERRLVYAVKGHGHIVQTTRNKGSLWPVA